ncbi:filamentous hemagglutinin family N-terminal domain-containing protein [Roseateles sp. YR242]|uniref:two-partner secretion domain-containing protein n=1 Tax=Roseateles sp. YR242 TaxID=1855305 RepID=UPI0008BD6202|nr:GLUG motif-containing protein [Roseateles sp. YR242]SEK82320.1 filamentous hemagglutinin family N-terminal domain-containing protein [Roseateles sp. YR242]
MNRIHRKIWSVRLGAFVAVAETARSRGKTPGGALVGAAAAVGLLMVSTAMAAPPGATTLPNGGQVSAGNAVITQSGAAMTVTQGTQRAAINWQGFSIGKDASVTFAQPNANAVMLNRVTGGQQSVIDGALKANGQVFLLNPNGVLFSSSARVDTAGLVATTRHLSDADFMAGKATFSGTGAGDVVNAGRLTAADGGYVALIGRQVRNDGVITARLGTVALAAGNRVSLNFDGRSLVGVTVDQGALEALVSNGGAVLADGGTVLLKATAAEALLDTVVNNTGQIQARSVGERNGKIVLLGEGGGVEVAGSLDATNTGAGNGGFIETSGPAVAVKAGAQVTTAAAQGSNGTWLIDPTNFEISAGSAASSTSGIGATTLQTALGAGNVTIQTQSTGSAAGDINVNAPVAWSANLLTLEAHGDINVNAVMSATGTSTLNLKTGYNFNTSSPTFNLGKTVRTKWTVDGSGTPSFVGRIDFDRTGTGLLTINGAAYTLINSLGASGSTTGTDLQGINGNLSGKYALASNIDATASAGWGSWGSGNGFSPIGRVAGFTGVIDGLGHVVFGYGLSASANNLGLVGQLNAASAAVRNIGVTNIVVGGDSPPNFGGLVGLLSAGSVSNAFATGQMAAYAPQSGGLVGLASAGTTISQSYAKVDITFGAGDAGGLVGRAETGAVIRDSSAAGNVSGPYGDNTGGLVGSINGATVTGSTASGTVDGTNSVGGLIGKVEGVSTVSTSSASGSATGGNNVGGLIGYISAGGATATVIDQTSASGDVTVSNSTGGGLIGAADGSGASVPLVISNSFAAGGSASGPGQIGGLLGYLNVGTVTDSYADTAVVASAPGSFWYGGLVGRARNMTIQRSYAVGDLTLPGNNWWVGGLIGETINGTLTDVYARGDVNSVNGRWAGGLIGSNSSTVSHAYATGLVTGSVNVGGLIGASSGGAVTDSFWDVETSGRGVAGGTAGSAGGTGRSTADMTTSSTFINAGWNLASGGIWARRDDVNDKYPVLRGAGYVERIGTILIDAGWLASTGGAPVVYSTAGLLAGDTMTLSQTGGVLSYSLNLTTSAGNYDGFVIAARAPSGDLNVNRPLAWNNFKLDLEAAGNLNINAVLSVTGSAQLDMKAGYNFNASAPVYAPGYRVNMGMDAAHAFTGRVDIDRAGTGILTINGEGYTLVNQLGSQGDEQLANGTLQGLDVFTNYALATNIDASSAASWNGGEGFKPIADTFYPYVGKFNGLGHGIDGLTINQTAPRHVALFQVGLFGLADNADFSNLALSNVNITGPGQVGALLGGTINNPSKIANVTVSGTVNATNANGGAGTYAGGLIGVVNNAGTSLTNVHATATVTASSDYAGGLVGSADQTDITASDSSGNVTGANNVGGLVGNASGGTINTSTATGTVTGANNTGGLLGQGQNGLAITDSGATGAVTGAIGVGGLVGVLDSPSLGNTVTTSYATGTVNGSENVGGLIGDSPYGGTVIDRSYASGAVTAVRFAGGFIGTGNAAITDAYATGNVTATDPSFAASGGFAGGGAGTLTLNRVYSSGVVSAADLGSSFGSGGLAGFGFYTVTNSFYDATKNPTGGGTGYGTGKTTAEMNSTSTYVAAGWDFTFGTGVWGRKDSINDAYPVLKAFGFTESIVVDLGVSSRPYGDANPSLAGATITGCPTVNCAGIITSVAWGTALDATTHAGQYALAGSNVLVFTYGGGASPTTFEVSYLVPTFTITPRVLSVAAAVGATQTYDGTTAVAASQFALGNVVNGDTVALSGSGVLDSAHAGTRGVASLGTLSVSHSDYVLASGAPTGTVTVTPRQITLAPTAGASRVYDGTSDASASLFTVSNAVAGDSLGLAGSATLDSSHAGGRTVTGAGSLSVANADYVLDTSSLTGGVTITPRLIDVTLVSGATRVFDNTSNLDASLFAYTGLLNGDSATLSGHALLDGAGVGNHTVSSVGTLMLSNGDYQVASTAPAGSVRITPADQAAVVTDELASIIATAQRTYVPTADLLGTVTLAGTSSLGSTAANVVNTPSTLAASWGEGTPLVVLSAPSGEEPSEGVTLAQARRMVGSPGGQGAGGSQEVRVPVSRNSLAEIVNGGVRLPGGVEQMLFVVKATK